MTNTNEKIMVIDDDEDDRILFCSSLKQISVSAKCLRSPNGKAALEYLTENAKTPPAVIFLDINMPVMTGWEFLTQIKSLHDLSAIPVIVFSSSSNQREVNIAHLLGAKGYCVKPDEPDDLRTILNFVIRNLDKNIASILSSSTLPDFFRKPSTN